MPSLVPGYEYDIFISYRHNDNLDGWVTDFVHNLENELRSTLKEPVSIYFDKNPHDGLLEMHHVDESLATKLKCVIFIPIVSQTYCAPNSFAWKHEFVAFVEKAKNDSLGINVALLNRNVASRVLPVQIHDIDNEDRQLFEEVLGSKLRPIELIYKEPGVNRPLSSTDNEDKNLNKTRYKNQLNKVANALKEITRSSANATHTKPVLPKDLIKEKAVTRKTPILLGILLVIAIGTGAYFFLRPKALAEISLKGRSIAVLPFRNDSNDPGNVYFCNGLMEDIINQLSQIPDVRVPSATSMLYYRDNPKPYAEIISELNVSYLLEASIRKTATRALMNITLIDAEANEQIWTDRMEMDLSVKDLFDIQYEVAKAVAGKMRITLSDNKEEIPTDNYIAYDGFLKARDLLKIWGIEQNNQAATLLRKAIDLDPKFQAAYSLLGQTYGQRTDITNSNTWNDSAYYFASIGYNMNKNNANALNALALTTATGGDHAKALTLYLEAYKINPNAPNNFAGWCYYKLGAFDKAVALAAKNIEDDPKNYIYYIDMAEATNALELFSYADIYSQKALTINPTLHLAFENSYETELARGNYAKALDILDKAVLISTNAVLTGSRGVAYYKMGNLEKASEVLNSDFDKSINFETDGPGIIANVYELLEYRALVKIKMGRQKEGIRELENIIDGINKYSSRHPKKYFLLAAAYATLGRKNESLDNLEQSVAHDFNVHWNYLANDLLDPIREEERYKKTVALVKSRITKMNEKVKAEGYLSE